MCRGMIRWHIQQARRAAGRRVVADQHPIQPRDDIWGDDDCLMGRTLDVSIPMLREYLRSDPDIQIVNYHGVGFTLEIR